MYMLSSYLEIPNRTTDQRGANTLLNLLYPDDDRTSCEGETTTTCLYALTRVGLLAALVWDVYRTKSFFEKPDRRFKRV